MALSVIDAAWPFWPAGIFSLFISMLIVGTREWHIHVTARGHAGAAVQSMHRLPTPRIGGIGLLFGLCCAAFIVSDETRTLLVLIVASCLPVFVAGLCEDVGIGASPRVRLLAAMAGSAAMIWVSGIMILSFGIPVLDGLLQIGVVAAVFTVIAAAGVSHAFNLVDGLNGLSTGIGLTTTTVLALMAIGVGDPVVAALSCAVLFSVLGVFLVNYPMGKLFLGDAGAYTLGHVIAWIAVLLMARNPEISPWAVVLAAFWPVMDTLASMVRRWWNKMPVGLPDRMHFHHVVLRVIERTIVPKGTDWAANSLATAAIAPLVLVPGVLAVINSTNNFASVIGFLFCGAMYLVVRARLVASYRQLAKHFQSRPNLAYRPASVHGLRPSDLLAAENRVPDPKPDPKTAVGPDAGRRNGAGSVAAGRPDRGALELEGAGADLVAGEPAARR